MHKLTVFTVILSIVVVIVVSELLFNNYLSNTDEGKVSILTSQSVAPSLLGADQRDVVIEGQDLEDIIAENSIEDLPSEDESDINLDDLLADESDIDIEILSLETDEITDESVKEAGFLGAGLVSASFDGSIFQTVDVSDLQLNVKKEYVASSGEVFGAIYRFSVDASRQNELYKVLRERAAFGTQTEVNETNTFGDNSFYMNDSRRETTAFLVIRSGSTFYGFAYPKKNHEHFKLLAQSL